MSRHIVVLVEKSLRTVSKGSTINIIVSSNILLVNLPKESNKWGDRRKAVDTRGEKRRNRELEIEDIIWKSVVQKQNKIECLKEIIKTKWNHIYTILIKSSLLIKKIVIGSKNQVTKINIVIPNNVKIYKNNRFH